MHFLFEVRHRFVEDLTFRNRPITLDCSKPYQQCGDLRSHPNAAIHAWEPAERAVLVLPCRKGREHRHPALFLIHLSEERSQTLSACLLLLGFEHPRRFVEKDVGELLVLYKRTLQRLGILLVCPCIDCLANIRVLVGDMIGNAAAIISRCNRENIAVNGSRQRRQSLHSKVNRFGNMLNCQGLVPCFRIAICEESFEVECHCRITSKQISSRLSHVLHIGQDWQVTHFAIAAALPFRNPLNGENRVVEGCNKRHMINGLFAWFEVELHLHSLNAPIVLSTIDIEDGLAFLSLIRSISNACRQRGLIPISQESRQGQLCHQLLLSHNGFLPFCSHHVHCMRQTMQMPRSETFWKGKLDRGLTLTVSP